MNHQVARHRPVPVLLVGVDADPVAGPGELGGSAAPLNEAEALGDEEALPRGVAVPGGPGARG